MSAQVIPFRPKPAPAAVEALEPSHSDIMCVLTTCLITGLSARARGEFNSRLQKMYDRAEGNQPRRAIVLAAAEIVCAPLKTGAA
jgi:hypothetical protein